MALETDTEAAPDSGPYFQRPPRRKGQRVRGGWKDRVTIVQYARQQAIAARELGMRRHTWSPAHWLKDWHQMWTQRRREYMRAKEPRS